MLDFLDNVQIVDENNYNDIMLSQVEPYLEKRRTDAFFIGSDGTRLHYEAYEKLLSRGSVIILHGFTESAEKFRETAYYFRKAGYSVFVPDLRGHGKSYHASDKTERIDIDSFDTYADDLKIFADSVVRPSAKNGRIYIYSHSLGSTVALLYLINHGGDIEKAVLSSPMICGNMGMPVTIASTVAKALCSLGGKKIPAPGRCVFNAVQTAEESDATSKARFLYYHGKRIKEPLYQTSGPSFSWVKASVEARDKILNNARKAVCKTELLIFKPEEDKQLLGSYTDLFAEKTKTKVKNVKNSRHEIFMSSDNVLRWYYGEILDFISD